MNHSHFKIASLFALAICFCNPFYGQDCQFIFDTQPCYESNYYFELYKSRRLYLEATDAKVYVEKFKVKAENFQIESHSYHFTATPTQLGKTALVAKVRLSNGKKVVVRKEVEIVQLPAIKLELASSNPEHDFMWLKLRDSLTGEDVSSQYNICMLEFRLESPSGQQKVEEVIISDKTYFPSISLRKFSSKFEISDKLIVTLRVTHKKFGLLQTLVPASFTITTLWH